MNNQKIANLLTQLAQEFQSEVPNTIEPVTGGSIPADYWTIQVPEGMTIEKAYAECEKLFSCWRYINQDLDKIVTSDRTTKKAYSFQVKANIEADENLKNLSVNDLRKKGIVGITLLERLLLEIDYFKKIGKHLDLENVTLCSGSRRSGGNVPSVDWSDDRLEVFWFSTDFARGVLRTREVVIL